MMTICRLVLCVLLSAVPFVGQAQESGGEISATPGTGFAAAAEADGDIAHYFAPPGSNNWFFGGGVGLGFGDVDYLELAPMGGLWLSPKASVGASLIYRYRRDSRPEDTISTSDYGGSVFGRYIVWNPLFLQAEVEYLNYEYLQFDLTTDRKGYTSVLLGGGAATPMGRNASAFATILYNVAYDSDDPGPYGSPWIVRFGFGFGF